MPRTSDAPATYTAVREGMHRSRRIVLGPAGWLTAWDILERGLTGSHTSLDRLLARAVNDNPFPKPARDATTRVRFWREGDVTLWVELERQRRERRLLQPDLCRGDAQQPSLEAEK